MSPNLIDEFTSSDAMAMRSRHSKSGLLSGWLQTGIPNLMLIDANCQFICLIAFFQCLYNVVYDVVYDVYTMCATALQKLYSASIASEWIANEFH